MHKNDNSLKHFMHRNMQYHIRDIIFQTSNKVWANQAQIMRERPQWAPPPPVISNSSWRHSPSSHTI